MAKLLKKIFSIENEYKENGANLLRTKHKVFNILGLKLKIKSKSSIGNKEISQLMPKNDFNENLLNIIISMQDGELFYLKIKDAVFIFTKELLKLDRDFVYNFLKIPYFLRMGNYQFNVMNKNCDLYKEHIEYAKRGELCWKYYSRYNGISCTVVYKKDNEIYIKRDFLGKENAFFTSSWQSANVAPRKYADGICLDDIVAGQDKETQIKIIKKFYDTVFEKYKTDNNDYISGDVIDFHFKNFIVSLDGEFHYIDAEFKSEKPIEKNFCIYISLYHYNRRHNNALHDLYKYFISLYNYPDKSNEYHKQFTSKFTPEKTFGKEKTAQMIKANKPIIDKYMSKEGLIPKYDEEITQIVQKLCD